MRWRTALYGFFILRASACEALAWSDAGQVASLQTAGWGFAALAAGVVLLGFVRRRRKAGAQQAMRVLAELPLGLGAKAVTVQIGSKQLILGVAPGYVRTLHVLEGVADPHPTGDGGSDDSKLTDSKHTDAGLPAANGAMEPEPRAYETQLAQVKLLADENPKLVAQTLIAWIKDE